MRASVCGCGEVGVNLKGQFARYRAIESYIVLVITQYKRDVGI